MPPFSAELRIVYAARHPSWQGDSAHVSDREMSSSLITPAPRPRTGPSLGPLSRRPRTAPVAANTIYLTNEAKPVSSGDDIAQSSDARRPASRVLRPNAKPPPILRPLPILHSAATYSAPVGVQRNDAVIRPIFPDQSGYSPRRWFRVCRATYREFVAEEYAQRGRYGSLRSPSQESCFRAR